MLTALSLEEICLLFPLQLLIKIKTCICTFQEHFGPLGLELCGRSCKWSISVVGITRLFSCQYDHFLWRYIKHFLSVNLGRRSLCTKNIFCHPGLFFFFSKQLTVNFQYKFCRSRDSNSGPLESEATALPTEPQPLPMSKYFSPKKIDVFSSIIRLKHFLLSKFFK